MQFIGYVLFLKHKLVRIRMKKRLKEAYETHRQGKMEGVELDQRLQFYLGILSHANEYKLSQAVKNAYWVRGGHQEFFTKGAKEIG